MKTITAVSMLLLPIVTLAGEPPIVIRNATVETLGKAGRIEKAMLLIRDGKIAAIGKSVDVPADATVIDAAGGTVMPGVIDPYFEVAVAAAGPETSAEGLAEAAPARSLASPTIFIPTIRASSICRESA